MNNLSIIAGVILAIGLIRFYYISNISSSNSLIQLSSKEDIITFAEKYYLQGDYNRAFESIELAKAENRCTKRCTLLYGLIRIKKGNYLEGIHYCQRVAKKDKCFPRAISCIAEGYYLINDFTKSLRYMNICIVCSYMFIQIYVYLHIIITYVYMYIFMYVYKHVNMYIYICIYMYIYIYMSTYIRIHIYLYIYICI
jgi:hypothetical protein